MFELLKHFEALPDSTRVRREVVLALTNYSPATLRRRIKAGLFPAPIRETRNMARWLVGDLRKALQVHAEGVQ